jgi:predicted amidohydrolase
VKSVELTPTIQAQPAASHGSRVIRVALVQAESALGTETDDPREANLETAFAGIDHAGGEHADLVVFGELFLTGYRTDEWLHRWASSIDPPGAEIEALARAAERHGVHVIIGLATFGPPVPGDIYNSAVFIGPRGVIGTYRKTHVAAFPTFDQGLAAERCYYSPGDDLPVFASDIGRIGIQICYDISFPEVSRVQTLKGADLLVNISASAGTAANEEYMDHFAFTRAAENAVWLVNCSVVGNQREDSFFGGSRVVAPDGSTVAKAKTYAEDTLIVDIDLDAVRTERAMSHILSTRNPAIYGALTKLDNRE